MTVLATVGISLGAGAALARLRRDLWEARRAVERIASRLDATEQRLVIVESYWEIFESTLDAITVGIQGADHDAGTPMKPTLYSGESGTIIAFPRETRRVAPQMWRSH